MNGLNCVSINFLEILHRIYFYEDRLVWNSDFEGTMQLTMIQYKILLFTSDPLIVIYRDEINQRIDDIDVRAVI